MLHKFLTPCRATSLLLFTSTPFRDTHTFVLYSFSCLCVNIFMCSGTQWIQQQKNLKIWARNDLWHSQQRVQCMNVCVYECTASIHIYMQCWNYVDSLICSAFEMFHLYALIISYVCKMLSLSLSLSRHILSIFLPLWSSAIAVYSFYVICCHLLRTTCLIIEPHKCLTRNLQFAIRDLRFAFNDFPICDLRLPITTNLFCKTSLSLCGWQLRKDLWTVLMI